LLTVLSLVETSERAQDRTGAVRLSDAVETYLGSLRVVNTTLERRERVLLRRAKDTAASRPKVDDISLLGFLGDPLLTGITSEDLLHHQNLLVDGGYAPESVRGFGLDVRHFFNFCVRHGYLDRSPAGALELPPSEPSQEIHYLTPSQVSDLLEAVGDPTSYDPQRRFHLFRNPDGRRPFLPTPGNNVLSLVLPGFVYLGVRRCELIRMEWTDVNLARRVVTIRGARKNPAKSERRRSVPLPTPLLAFLGEKERTCSRVFTNSEGRPWTATALQSALRRFRKVGGAKLGFEFDFQTLRRTYGSILFQEDFTLDQIAEYLGHSDTKTTRRWYAALRAEDHHDRVTRALAF
jgi:integrase